MTALEMPANNALIPVVSEGAEDFNSWCHLRSKKAWLLRGQPTINPRPTRPTAASAANHTPFSSESLLLSLRGHRTASGIAAPLTDFDCEFLIPFQLVMTCIPRIPVVRMSRESSAARARKARTARVNQTVMRKYLCCAVCICITCNANLS